MTKPGKVPLRARAPWLAAALLAVFAFLCALFPMTDTDVWWHLSAGRWMWEHRAVPRADVLCASSYGEPWLDAQWGFQLLLYPLWLLGGAFALVAAKALAFAGIFALVFLRGWTPRAAPFLSALGVFAAFHGRHLADVRPVWATTLLLAWQYRLLRDALDGRRAFPWVLLLLSQIAMAQMQGLHWLGPLQFAVVALGAPPVPGMRRKNLALFSGALLLAGLANPYGWKGFAFPLELLGRILPTTGNLFSREVAENVPFWRWLAENPAGAAPFLILAVVALGLLAAAVLRGQGRGARGEAALLLMYGTLGVMAQRNLIFFLMAFLIVAARTLPPLLARAHPAAAPAFPGARLQGAALFAGAWTLFSLAGYAGQLRDSWRWEGASASAVLRGAGDAWETPLRFPRGAVDYLRAHPLRGPIFNEMRHGGYLGWHLEAGRGGEPRPFIDGRMILHDAAFMREFLDLFDHPERFEAYRIRHDLRLVVLPIGEDARYFPLAVALARSPPWRVLYVDGAEILLARPEAWLGSREPPAWMPEAGEASARSRFGANPRLLSRARGVLAAFEAHADSPGEPQGGGASLRARVAAAEADSKRLFPASGAYSVSLTDTLAAWRRRLEAAGFASLPAPARARVLAEFLFDSAKLVSVDEGDDFALSLPSRVVQDRRGSCVGLVLLLMSLAEEMGVDARPVFLPGHVFVRLRSGARAWRNVELLRGGLARDEAFYREAFRLRERPWYRLESRAPASALAALFFNRANALVAEKRFDEALLDYRRSENLLPGFPDALGGEGSLLLRAGGERREGLRLLEKSVEGDPLSPPARANLRRAREE